MTVAGPDPTDIPAVRHEGHPSPSGAGLTPADVDEQAQYVLWRVRVLVSAILDSDRWVREDRELLTSEAIHLLGALGQTLADYIGVHSLAELPPPPRARQTDDLKSGQLRPDQLRYHREPSRPVLGGPGSP